MFPRPSLTAPQDLYLERLRTIRATCLSSPFFSSHEFVGSSLLFVNDRDTAGLVVPFVMHALNCAPGIWMIDFEKTRGVSPPAPSSPRGDGYLIGLDSAIDLLSSLSLPASME